jgi:CheY-like chemotaxis protein
MHGGSITVQSPGLGKGSTFTVRLPLAPAAAQAPTLVAGSAPVLPDAASSAGAKRRRVLVVDDNVDNANMLALLLDALGHDVKTAHSGPEALAVARTYAPEVMLVDIGLPGFDGYEVARRLRAEPDTAGIVLVAVTGWGSDEDKRKASAAGFDAHLTKPVAMEVLRDVLARSPPNRGCAGGGEGKAARGALVQ